MQRSIRRKSKMQSRVFRDDVPTDKELIILPSEPITESVFTISDKASEEAVKKGDAFAQEIEDRFVSDFEKPGDKMAHVSTFRVIGDTVYMTYYANTKEPSEDPKIRLRDLSGRRLTI